VVTLQFPGLDFVANQDLEGYRNLMLRSRTTAKGRRQLKLDRAEVASVRAIGHGREAVGWLGSFLAISLVVGLSFLFPDRALNWRVFGFACLLVAGPFGGYYLEAARIRSGVQTNHGGGTVSARANVSLANPWPGAARTTASIFVLGLLVGGAMDVWYS
jgi:uncharacterized membrane protein